MKKISMRLRVLLTILPIAIIPVILVTWLSASRLFNKLQEQSNVFYATVTQQISKNIDFVYTQYVMSFVDISNLDNFHTIINKKKFASEIEEKNFLPDLGETSGSPSGSSITRAAYVKFKGPFFLLDTKKTSLVRQTPFFLPRFSTSDYEIDGESFLSSHIFQEHLRFAGSAKPIFINSPPEVVNGFEVEKTSLFVYPYAKEDELECSTFFFVIMNKDFIPDMYKDVESIKYGTLYVLDSHNNILSSNHPSSNDYYIYDYEKNKYLLEDGDPVYDPYEKMGINDYRMLNTDPKILDDPKVVELLEQVSNEEYDPEIIHIVNYKGSNFLVQTSYAPEAAVKTVYFQPIMQIYKPILNVIFLILIFSLVIIIIIAVLSMFISHKLNMPISLLLKGANKVSDGDYKTHIETAGFFGEFVDLGDAFNSMTTTINEYSENLEGLVQQRTAELEVANNDLQKAYDENKRELLMAQRIQATLIPKVFPENENFDFSGMYLPMEALGGDLYDAHKISETKMGVMILDVCGHGVPAALITTMAKISFNSNSKIFSTSSEIMANVNEEMCDAIQGSGDYFTAFYCIIDIEKNTIEYTNAAHNEVYLLRTDGSITDLTSTGPVVGVVKSVEYQNEMVPIHKGDRLILYTDGVVEARDKARTLYDTQRFQEAIFKNKEKSPKEFVSYLYNDILSFKEDTPHDDDIALLVVDII